MLLIALASILYGSAMAFTTTRRAADPRATRRWRSSGFITLGIFALRPQGAQGAVLQTVNHGLVVAPAFFIVALLAARAGGSEDIRDMGGLAFRAPVLATLFLIVALANLAMPGSSNFVGEFLILLGVFKAKLVIAIVAFTGVALASVYTLRLFIRAMHNRVGADVGVARADARPTRLVLVPLVAVILFLALYPQFALKRTTPTRAVAKRRRRAEAREPMIARRRQGPAHRLGGALAALALFGGAIARAAARPAAPALRPQASCPLLALAALGAALGLRIWQWDTKPTSSRARCGRRPRARADRSSSSPAAPRRCCSPGARRRRARPPTASTSRCC